MHPILAQRQRLAIYLLAWMPVAALLTAALVLTGWGGWLQSLLFAFPLLTVYAFLCLAAWYPCRALPLGQTRTGVALTSHIAAAAVSSALWVAMAWLLARAFSRSTIFAGEAALTADQIGLLFVVGLLLYLLSVAVHYLFVAAELGRAAERRALEAEVAAREAEFQALKAQLNPHFLFNSLNSIASLAVTDPPGAREMCVQLGDYLRFTLSETSAHMEPLAKELEQVRRFLAVEQVRFGERLRVVEKIGHECVECLVPPLLLQPLVENALKHGIAGLVDGGEVEIGARCDGGQLVLWVENPVDTEAPPRAGAGVGLLNVRRRLEGVFGGEATLRHARSGETYRTEIVIPTIQSGEVGSQDE
ncbi:MAG: histidine kinase [Acidobacteria bacterium]|nr:histidine kinase [Acidobacteriota bacterium]